MPGTGGATGATGGTAKDEHVVVLGGGFCSVGPARSGDAGLWAFAALGFLGVLRARRRGAKVRAR
jgi:MYXO-CTERM domain-containing protein